MWGNKVEKLKQISKKTWVVLLAIIVICGGSWYFWSHRKVSVLDKQDLNMHFEGYNGSGTAMYNSDKISKKIGTVLAKRAKLGDYWTDKVVNDTDSLEDIDDGDLASVSSDDRDKIVKVSHWFEELNYEVSKEDELSNGDKIQVKIDPGNDKTNPIKAQKITYKVKGLKKVKSASTTSILGKIKVSFMGYNGHGRVVLTTKDKKLLDKQLSIKNNGKLTNGDQIKVVAPKGFFQKEGIKYTGKKYLSETVSGLSDLSKVSNVAEVQKVTDSLIEDEIGEHSEEDTVETKLLGIYALPKKADGDYDDTYEASSTEPEVTVKSKKKSSKNQIAMVALYKVTTTYSYEKDDPFVDYRIVTLNKLEYENSKVSINQLNTDDDAEVGTMANSPKTEQHNLSTDGVKVK